MKTQTNSGKNPDFYDQKSNIYELSQSNFSVISKYEGTLISITLPKESVRKERTYLRFRISGSDLLSFSRIEKNVSSVFGSAFTKTEILDFRINSTRHLPNKLLEEINQARMFNILKIHFFYICSYRENYVLSHQPFSGARRLEDDIWTEYISATPGNSFDSNQETLIAYHWKEKANASNIIDDFSVLMKTSFRHNDWTTIIKYIIFLLIFSIVTGLIANFLFSHLTDYSKNKDTPSITTPANNNNEIVDKTKLDSPPNQVEVEEQNNKQR